MIEEHKNLFIRTQIHVCVHRSKRYLATQQTRDQDILLETHTAGVQSKLYKTQL